MAGRPRPRRPARLLSLVAVRAGQHDGFPRRREPRSGAVAARSIPLSPVCSGLSTVCGGELERGPPHPPINAPAPNPLQTRLPAHLSRESGNPGRPRSVIPAQAGTSQRRGSGAIHPPLHRLRGRVREGAAPPANQRTRTQPATDPAPRPSFPRKRESRTLPSVIPAKAGTSQRRGSGAIHPPLHRLRGRVREGAAPPANQRPLPPVDRRPTPAATLAPYPNPPDPRKINLPAMPSSNPRTASSPTPAPPDAATSLLPTTPPTPLASRNNKKLSPGEVSEPWKQATAMKTPSKTPGSPCVFGEVSRLAPCKTGNFLLVPKMTWGTFLLVTKMSWGTFFHANGELPRPRPALPAAPSPAKAPQPDILSPHPRPPEAKWLT